MVRGGEPIDIYFAISKLAEDDPIDAVVFLDRYLRSFHELESIERAHYIAGLGWMRLADRHVLGLYSSVDRNAARNAIIHFEAVVTIPGNTLMVDDARYQLIRLYAIVGDKTSCIAEIRQLESSVLFRQGSIEVTRPFLTELENQLCVEK